MTKSEIANRLRQVVAHYPAAMRLGQSRDIPRIAFNIHLSLPANRRLAEAAICDLGGGIGLFSVGCAAIGFGKVILVDDFRDQINREVGDSVFAVHRRYGVSVVSRDIISDGIGDLDGLDVLTSFDSMEHWHHSPKSLFREAVRLLKPRGRFVLGVPNCVNLRKRLTVPFGIGKWSSMEYWYESPVFRGHVREPDIDDLRYIARDLGLENARILGRNWLGYKSRFPWVRWGTGFCDHALRCFPSLCADIYLVGQKSAGVGGKERGHTAA